MRKIFAECASLDARCRSEYGLTEDIMMENAAAALEAEVRRFLSAQSNGTQPCGGQLQSLKTLPCGSQSCGSQSCGGQACSGQACGAADVLIVTGSGNNGADGWALARRLTGTCIPAVYPVKEPASAQCIAQAARAEKSGVRVVRTIVPCRVLVECISGSGFSGKPAPETEALLTELNGTNAYRIACDVPCGVDGRGTVNGTAFNADVTVTMGALKTALVSDEAKDHIGSIIVADLGIGRARYENTATDAHTGAGALPGTSDAAGAQSRNAAPDAPAAPDSAEAPAAPFSVPEPELFLLERGDVRLPLRTGRNTWKNAFGHCAVFSGEKDGASILAASAALAFGAGLATLVQTQKRPVRCPPSIMYGETLPESTTALLAGPGLGAGTESAVTHIAARPELPCVLDADMLRHSALKTLLENRRAGCVVTPHPGELRALLEQCGFGEPSAEDIRKHRIELLRAFCARYPNVTLVSKGANTFVADAQRISVFTGGTGALSKAGSGDVLAGLICALLAQGYAPREAAETAVFVHGTAGARATEPGGVASYGLIPELLIEAVRTFRAERANV